MIDELAQRLFLEVDKKSREISKLHNALKKLASADTLESPRQVGEACKILERSDPKALGLEIDFTELLKSTAADQQQRANRRKIEFGRMLHEKAESQGLACKMITSEPMEFSLPPFTVSVNLDQNMAQINYARLALEELPAKPDQIPAACLKNLKMLEKGWSSEQFFDALCGAYRIQIFEEKSRPGERLVLTDLIPYVALSFQSEKFRSDPVAGNYSPYGRARMAYDLSRLRRSGLLQRNGWRVNLGAATGSSTQNKKGVLYVEENPGQGQYYLTIWFSPAGS
ncbi:MAG: hypothetical protein C4530_18015 [Desulfobacteraceae bacterium]|nr:MAG: hypothetical protein C4530_18015 [Desulfobacteraceae bacterium]